MAKRYIDDEVRQRYLEWLMDPPGDRVPATKEEMAALLGVSRKTLYNWENSDEFQNELRRLREKWGVRYHSDILGRLMEIVQNGVDKDSVAAARVLLSHLRVDVEEESSKMEDERRDAIKEELEALGFKTLDKRE